MPYKIKVHYRFKKIPCLSLCFCLIYGFMYFTNIYDIQTRYFNKPQAFQLSPAVKNVKASNQNIVQDINRNPHILELNLPYHDMLNLGLREGCEGGVALSCLQYKGYASSMNLIEFYKQMPHAPKGDVNPHHGFIGSEYTPLGILQTIYPDALIDYMKTFGDCKLTNGYTPKQLIQELKKGNPSICWVTSSRLKTPVMRIYPWGKAVRNSHCIALVGYNDQTGEYKVMDSGGHRGTYWVSKSKFETSYNKMKYAITVY